MGASKSHNACCFCGASFASIQPTMATPQRRLRSKAVGGRRALRQGSRNSRIAANGSQHLRISSCFHRNESSKRHGQTTHILNRTTLLCVIHTIVVRDNAGVVGLSRWKECEDVGWLVVLGSWCCGARVGAALVRGREGCHLK